MLRGLAIVQLLACLTQVFGLDKCYPLQSDFKADCESELSAFGGSVDGGRCFYVLPTFLTWTEAWSACRANGSVLAQFHSASEYQMVFEYIRKNIVALKEHPTYIGSASLIAMRDEAGGTSACGLSGTTSWYDDETTPNLLIPINVTYAKYAYCKDTGVLNKGPRCLSVYWTDDNCTKGIGLQTAGWHAVCQFTNEIQNFTRTNMCMTERSIESITPASSPQTCADECAQRNWCRSFNFIDDRGQQSCQLFCRSIHDCEDGKIGECPSYKQENGTCVHYNYVQ